MNPGRSTITDKCAGAVQNMAVKALQLARKANRKNFRFSDIEQVVRKDRRCVDMCLKDVLCTEATFAQVRAMGSQAMVVIGTGATIVTQEPTAGIAVMGTGDVIQVNVLTCGTQARGELPDGQDTEEAAAGKENDGIQTEREPGKALKGKAPPKDLAGVRQISTFFKP